MIIHGRSLTSHSFAGALHAALRVLVDDLECPSFNAAVGGMTHQAVDTRPLTSRHDKTDQRAVRQGYCLAADMRNQNLPAGGANVGRCNTSIQCSSAFQRLQGHCQVLLPVPILLPHLARRIRLQHRGICICIHVYECRIPVGVRRVVSRGDVSSRSSDFGALEVFAGASIGHTDPYVVHAAISRRLSAVSGNTIDQV